MKKIIELKSFEQYFKNLCQLRKHFEIEVFTIRNA